MNIFKREKENKIIKTDISFRTTDPTVDYIKYDGDYYYIETSHIQTFPFEFVSAEGTNTGIMCNMQITEMIKIPEELKPLIRKEKYYSIDDYPVAYIIN